MDRQKAIEAVKQFLEAVGEDPSREGLQETPRRVADMFAELLRGKDQTAQEHLERTFTVTSGEMVLEKDIAFSSTCEHHLMPFFGKIAIAYIPNGRVVGLSKLARTVDVYASRLQLQEQLTQQIADAIMDYLAPLGVMVLCSAEHTCMTCRGVKKAGSQTLTYAVRGNFSADRINQVLSLCV